MQLNCIRAIYCTHMAEVLYALWHSSLFNFVLAGIYIYRALALIRFLVSRYLQLQRYLYMHSLALMHHTLYPGRTPALIWVSLLLHVDCVKVKASR